MSQRVVVTGAGAISSIGAGMEAFAGALFAGKRGIRPSARFGGVAAEVPESDLQRLLPTTGIRTLDRTARLLSVTVQMTLETAGLLPYPAGGANAGLGLVCGTMFGSLQSITSFDWSGIVEGPNLVNPMQFPNTVLNSAAGQAGIRHGLRGLNTTLSAGLASGLYALHHAAECLRLGRASALLAGGVEELCEASVRGLRRTGFASPSGRVNPFGKDRDGTVPAEGCALWLLEDELSARARGAIPILEICGFSALHDRRGSHIRSTGDVAAGTMKRALAEAGVSPAEVSCVVASASGSPDADELEARALRTVFGSHLEEVPVCAPKAAFGEPMGAGGAFCALSAGLALGRGMVPPTPGSEVVSGLNLSPAARPMAGDCALINAFGCDGNNASMVIRAWKN